MVSLLNGGLSDGNPNKRALENGFPCSRSGNTPNYKPRKISALRDFPRMCGPHAQQIIPEPQHNGGVAGAGHLAPTVGADCLSCQSEGDTQSSEAMKSPARVHFNGRMVIPHFETVPVVIEANEGNEVATRLHVATETNEIRMPEALEQQEIVAVPVENGIHMVEKADVIETSELDIQYHEVLESSVGEKDNNISLDDLMGEVVAIVTEGVDNQLEEKVLDVNPVGVELPKDLERKSFELSKELNGEEAQPLGKQLDNQEPLALIMNVHEEDAIPLTETGPLVDGDVLVKQDPVPITKDKFRVRRVSAIRDFPPNCGPNISPLSKEECLIIDSGDKSLIGIARGHMENKELETSKDAVDLKKIEKSSLTTSPRIAAKGCLLGEAAVADSKEIKENVEVSGRLSPQNRISNAASVEIHGEDKVSDGKEIVLYGPFGTVDRRPSSDIFTSFHNEEPVIVNALMAAPHCPWRRGKMGSNSDAVKALETSAGDSVKSCTETAVAGGGETKGNIEDSGLKGSEGMVSPPNRISNKVQTYEKDEVSKGKEIVHYEAAGAVDRRLSSEVFTSHHSKEPMVVNALVAVRQCPELGKVASSSDAAKTGGSAKKRRPSWQRNSKAFAKKSTIKVESSERLPLKRDSVSVHKDAEETPVLPVVKYNEEEYGEYGGPSQDLLSGCTRDVEVTLPPHGPSSTSGDARNKVRETLRLFQTICRKLLQGEESKPRPESRRKGEESKSRQELRRIDLEAAKIMKKKGKEITGKKYLGAVPGVEVGDEFHYRVELAMVGVHRLYQAGIDFMKHNGMLVAISIVASGAYADDMVDADSLIYSGQGGNIVGKDKKAEDQKLERGNLALRNSISAKNPVRVIHGSKDKETRVSDSSDSKCKIVTTYVYDGLYTVENYWQEKGKHGNQVFMFRLKRIPGQPELAWKELKKSKKSKVRLGVCIEDITGGKELIPICAVNTVSNEKPPPFSYITRMIYADWSHLLPPEGCDCTGRCSDSVKCSCAQKNGGEIPYNRNGAIVEAKPLVYECGPSCKCPPSCYNRVSQSGIKVQLEIFRTETRGWGVRSLSSIPSGTFICEYVGELLEDKEAEQRTHDEYLFDIGQNYSDLSIHPDGRGSLAEPMEEEVGYTIDAAYYGNVGRFINHSCSPNLYAQNVLYDHDDKRMPHIMLFAAENIPALKELTYHYNYSVDQVRDSDGNIKMKSCYCGSAECAGRMY